MLNADDVLVPSISWQRCAIMQHKWNEKNKNEKKK
jgi:hypothetical protein